ncbi:MAG: sulfatase-like hydrolase/transferase [Planctomycetota bacterium]|jgi:arylsulfatase A-like enzyme
MKKPNILFVFTDQHAKSSIGAYGSKFCKTPHLDSLAKGGVVFDNAYTTCPVCSPARASVQTGVYPFRHGMQTNIFQAGCMVHELPDRPYLLSRRLNEAGYKAGYTGKWHMGYGKAAFEDDYYNAHIFEIDRFRDFVDYPDEYRGATALPTALGYIGDDFPGHGAGGYFYPQYKEYLQENNLELKTTDLGEYGHVVTSGEETTIDYYLIERSREIISEMQDEGKPWFHMLNLWGPHEPYYPPQTYYDKYKDLDVPEWESFSEDQSEKPRIHKAKRPGHDWEHFQDELRLYYAYAEFVDAQIGRLFDWLKETGEWDNTVVIFSADHGDSMGVHGGLVDKSLHLYEETVSIPLVIKHPDNEIPHREKRFANLTDIYAYIVDLAGLDVDVERCHGRSLKPLVHNEECSDWTDQVMVESSGLGPALHTSRMLRAGEWKYIFNCGGIDELYNLSEDPFEQNNQINNADAADILKDLQDRLGAWLEEKNDPLAIQYPLLIK